MGRRILCYGDSNTYGYDPRSCLGGRYSESVRWTALLQAQGWDIFNAGQNGRSIPRNGWEIETLAQMLYRQQPDIITVMLGSNDLLQDPGLSAAGCGERMEGFLAVLLKQALSCQLLLIAPPPMALGAWVDDPKIIETSQSLSAQYQALAQKLGIAFADANDWNVELTFDGVHFSECGHRTFFVEIANDYWHWEVTLHDAAAGSCPQKENICGGRCDPGDHPAVRDRLCRLCE